MERPHVHAVRNHDRGACVRRLTSPPDLVSLTWGLSVHPSDSHPISPPLRPDSPSCRHQNRQDLGRRRRCRDQALRAPNLSIPVHRDVVRLGLEVLGFLLHVRIAHHHAWRALARLQLFRLALVRDQLPSGMLVTCEIATWIQGTRSK